MSDGGQTSWGVWRSLISQLTFTLIKDVDEIKLTGIADKGHI
jgi:hypothetical protein